LVAGGQEDVCAGGCDRFRGRGSDPRLAPVTTASLPASQCLGSATDRDPCTSTRDAPVEPFVCVETRLQVEVIFGWSPPRPQACGTPSWRSSAARQPNHRRRVDGLMARPDDIGAAADAVARGRGSRARRVATMPKMTSTWRRVSTHTNGSTGASRVLVQGSRSVAEPRHWLAGRLAVVTGASRGIGAATAEAIAATGAHVLLAARAKKLSTPSPDASETRAAKRLRQRPTSATSGTSSGSFPPPSWLVPPRPLVCAAGVLTSASFAQTTPEIWEQTLAVNLTGSFLVLSRGVSSRCAAPAEADRQHRVAFRRLCDREVPGPDCVQRLQYGVIGLTERSQPRARHTASARSA